MPYAVFQTHLPADSIIDEPIEPVRWERTTEQAPGPCVHGIDPTIVYGKQEGKMRKQWRPA